MNFLQLYQPPSTQSDFVWLIIIHFMALPSVSLHSFFEQAMYLPTWGSWVCLSSCWNIVSTPSFFKVKTKHSSFDCILVSFFPEAEPNMYILKEIYTKGLAHTMVGPAKTRICKVCWGPSEELMLWLWVQRLSGGTAFLLWYLSLSLKISKWLDGVHPYMEDNMLY